MSSFSPHPDVPFSRKDGGHIECIVGCTLNNPDVSTLSLALTFFTLLGHPFLPTKYTTPPATLWSTDHMGRVCACARNRFIFGYMYKNTSPLHWCSRVWPYGLIPFSTHKTLPQLPRMGVQICGESGVKGKPTSATSAMFFI